MSRTHPELVKRLFESEVTEVKDGIVEIKSISREAGSRTKIAVWSNDPDVDPVGACVGVNGVRVNAIVNELRGEKIDIINWSDNAAMLIENALSPAKVISVIADADEKTAKVVVPDYQLSLAIGKEGQNARLAARLTGFKIDIKSETQAREAGDFMDYENDYEEYEEDFAEDAYEGLLDEEGHAEDNGLESGEEGYAGDYDSELGEEGYTEDNGLESGEEGYAEDYDSESGEEGYAGDYDSESGEEGYVEDYDLESGSDGYEEGEVGVDAYGGSQEYAYEENLAEERAIRELAAELGYGTEDGEEGQQDE